MGRKKPRTCGHFGGTLRDGRPCSRKPGWGRRGAKSGPCRDHGPEGEARLQALKKGFLAELAKGTVSLKEAAQRVGHDQATIWRWRQGDPAFDIAVGEAIVQADDIRVSMVEDSLFARVASGKAAAAEMIFYLCNRAPHRWRHVQTVQHTGKVKHEPWDFSPFSDEELRKLEQFGRRAAAVGRN